MTDRNEEKERNRRLFDTCSKYQKEWELIRYALSLVPGHEDRIRELEYKHIELKAKLITMDELPNIIKSAVGECMADVIKDVSAIKTKQQVMQNQQNIFIEDKKLSKKIIYVFAGIGLLSFFWVISNLTLPELMKTILKIGT